MTAIGVFGSNAVALAEVLAHLVHHLRRQGAAAGHVGGRTIGPIAGGGRCRDATHGGHWLAIGPLNGHWGKPLLDLGVDAKHAHVLARVLRQTGF